MGARPPRDPGPRSSSTAMAGALDGRGRGRPRRRRRRPHRRQRRRGEQDRHLLAGGARPAPRRSPSPSPHPRRRSTWRRRSGAAIPVEERAGDEVTTIGGVSIAPAGFEALQPGVRRHPGEARDRDRHRDRRPPRARPPGPGISSARGGASAASGARQRVSARGPGIPARSERARITVAVGRYGPRMRPWVTFVESAFPTFCPGCGERAEPGVPSLCARARGRGAGAAPAGRRRMVGTVQLRGRGPRARGPDEVPERAGDACRGWPRAWRTTCATRVSSTACRSSRGRRPHRSAAGREASNPPRSSAARWRVVSACPSAGCCAGCRGRRRPAGLRRSGAPVRASPPGSRLPGVAVLVVDDVATTGATVAAAAHALRSAGAASIVVATAARTPHPGWCPRRLRILDRWRPVPALSGRPMRRDGDRRPRENLRVPTALRTLATEKVQKIERFTHDASRVEVDFEEVKSHRSAGYVCEITVHLKRHFVKASANAQRSRGRARPRPRQGAAPGRPDQGEAGRALAPPPAQPRSRRRRRRGGRGRR